MIYITDREQPPKKPVVFSQAAAQSEVRRWLSENDLHRIEDGSGLHWNLKVHLKQRPDPNSPNGLLWDIMLHVSTVADSSTLVRTGTLDPEADKRLLSLLGDELVSMSVRPRTLTAPHAEAVRSGLAEEVSELRARFKEGRFDQVKRNLVGRWIDERCWFHGP